MSFLQKSDLKLSYFQKLRDSKFRHVVWPIRSSELAKFIPMSLLMFSILLNQNIIRGIKDSIIVTYVGPEVISFIKFWGDMPAGFLFIIFYTKLCNCVTSENAFRIIVISFLSFFTIFTFIIFPNHILFHPDPDTIKLYILQFPHLKWFITIWGKWSFVLFYIMGELWPVVVFSLLYWQLANKITKTEEASRFYSFFSLFGQSNLLVSGSIIIYFAEGKHFIADWFKGGATDEVMVKSLMVIIIISTIILLLLHRLIEINIINSSKNTSQSINKEVLKMGFRNSIKTVLSSKYLGLICCMIISYSVTMNLIEGLWMSKVKELYPTTDQFISYHGKVLFVTGIFTLFCSFLGSSIIRYWGWYWGAVISPIIILIAGTLFFSFAALQKHTETIIMGIGYTSPLFIIVIIGAIQNIVGKGVKYSVFDTTKEMTYIPLDDEMKTKGKAAVEIAGMKIGKACGAALQFSIFSIFPSARYDDIIVFLMISFIVICVIWISSVKALYKYYLNLLTSNTAK